MTWIGGIIGVATGIYGAASSNSQRQAQNKAIDNQYKYDKKIWKFNNEEAERLYDYQVEGIAIQRQNIEAEYAFRDYNAKRDWAQQMRIADYEYNNSLKQYAQAEKNYSWQLQFNNIAAAQAYESEQRKLKEIKIGQVFQEQDLMVRQLQEEGEAQVTGQSGRSQGKSLQSAVASYGRNLAVLAESISSAEKQFNVSMKKIAVEKLGADLAAEAARMIKPERLPTLPPPVALPRPTLQDPLKPKKPPKPIRGSMAASTLGLDIMSTVAKGAAQINFGLSK